jgi:two-component system, NtrC family, response regulator AtoC
MKEKILVVDDEEVLRNLANEILSEEGYQVTLAGSAEEALEQMKQQTFDLVIADFKLPRMNGMELLKKVKAKDKDIQVILLTSHLSPTTALSSLEAGAFWYLTKPLDDISVFTEKVKLALLARKKGKASKPWERS